MSPSGAMSQRGQPIEVFNRHTGVVELEPVFGERWLRWTYETQGGRIALALLARRALFSRLYGWWMDRRRSARLVPGFVAAYGIDANEFAEPLESFRTFNEFFTRALKPDSRPIAADPSAVVFPADGRHVGFQDIGEVDRVYAKGQKLPLFNLLGDEALSERFSRGSLVISRLCPVDYHRFHFPCGGQLIRVRPIAGPLCSVNPIAVRRSLEHLVRNKRLISIIEGEECGQVAMVEIGATCVGTIVHTAMPGTVRRGEEKGCFRFGGSCVMTLFEPARVRLDDDLRTQTAAGRELYAHMGERMGLVRR